MALLFTVLLTLSALALFYALIDMGKRDFLRETESAIDIEINTLSAIQRSDSHILSYIQKRQKHDPLVAFRYENTQGKIIGGTINPVPQIIERIAEGIIGFDIKNQFFAAKIYTFDDGKRLIVARNIDTILKGHERFKHLSILIVGLMLVVILVSFGISYFVVSRINRIAYTAQHIIDTGDLSQRLTIDSGWDDLSNLAQILNLLLTRVERLMSSAREASNSIAHDLRTPLTVLRQHIEELKNQKITDDKIDGLLYDVDRILNIFQALLRITNIEKCSRYTPMGEVLINTLIADVIELYEPVADEKSIKIVSSTMPNASIWGDKDLLFQMFANIVDNAVKFSPPYATINISLVCDADNIMVLVQDEGMGIPDTEKEQVFKHFYRGDASRSTQGHGLGLSLVRAVAEQHKAHITLENAAKGLCVRVTFKSYK